MNQREQKECVMLAAGLSSRMGKWKMMMPWGAGTILDSALSSALSFCDRVVLVTGHRSDELAAYYENHPAIEILFNPDYHDGMFSSVQRGCAAVQGRRFFLALGDMPEVGIDVYRALWSCADEHSCIIPRYNLGKGHPILLPRGAIDVIQRATEGSTLKDVIKELQTSIISVTEQGIHWDIDTPEQYAQLAGRL